MKRLCLLLAIATLACGAYIPAKAALAQVFLRVAWTRALRGAPDARPWPWADTHAVARMILDRTGSDFIILEGANGRALAFAPAHLEQTALPGEEGNCVISAHRDTHFAALRDVVPGDVVRIQRSDGAWITYSIEGTRIIDKHDTWVTQNRGGATLTLITCYPFDAIVPGGPQRYVAWGGPPARRSAGGSPAGSRGGPAARGTAGRRPTPRAAQDHRGKRAIAGPGPGNAGVRAG